jgi:hypothetical protein
MLGFANHHVVSGYLSSIRKRCYARGRNVMWVHEKQPNGRYHVWMGEELAPLFDKALTQARS